MTIGIAAAGPAAGEAVLRGLAAVEAVGTGAIGGFVSLAAIVEGEVRRLETQTGGAQAILAAAPGWLASAERAVLMSSGPNRPEPLAQFTPGDAAVGLLTGHRFPNSRSREGVRLNDAVLALMRDGRDPSTAIADVLARNRDADAGIIALTTDGRIALGDAPFLDGFGDRGQILLEEGEVRVAVLHNAIRPYRGIALIAAETALEDIQRRRLSTFDIVLAAGARLEESDRTLLIAAPEQPVRILVSRPHLLAGEQSFGLGYHVPVVGTEYGTGWLAYEPYLVALNGILQSVDGKPSCRLLATYRK